MKNLDGPERRLSPGVREALIASWEGLLRARPLFGESIDGLGGGPGSRCWRIHAQHHDLLAGVNPRRLLDEAVLAKRRSTWYSRLPVKIELVSDHYPTVLLLLVQRALRRRHHHSTRRALRRLMDWLVEDYDLPPPSAIDLLGALV